MLAFRVSCYEPREKWPKERWGQILTFDDLAHYQQVVVALKETIRLMAEVDAAVPAWPVT